MSELHVVFGTGPLGRSCGDELVRLGKRVVIVNRKGQAPNLGKGITIAAGDAYDKESVGTLIKGAHSVYLCSQPPYAQWEGNFPRMQDAMIAGAEREGVRLIAAENLYAYGHPMGKPLTEQTPLKPSSKKGRIRKAMTDVLFQAHAQGRVKVAAVRGSNFFGPWDRVFSDLVFIPAVKGKAINLLGRTDQPHTFTYAPDFGRALAYAGSHDEALGKAWHVPSSGPITQTQLVEMIEKSLGKKVKFMVAGKFMVSLLGLFVPDIRETKEMLYEWLEPFVMDGSAMESSFGLKATPWETRIQETLDWVRWELSSRG